MRLRLTKLPTAAALKKDDLFSELTDPVCRRPILNATNSSLHFIPSGEGALRRHYRFLSKDFIETADGLCFAVISHGPSVLAGEPPQLVVALRYQRTPRRWKKFSTQLAREYLRANHPEWLTLCPQRDAPITRLPTSAIVRHFRPSESLREQRFASQVIFQSIRELGRATHAHAFPLGVTGSFLIGAQRESSDIDLVTYGSAAFDSWRQAFQRAVARGQAKLLDDRAWRETHHRRGCELDFESYHWHERRKRNKFFLGARRIDLSCVVDEPPIARVAGSKQGQLTITARVLDDSLSFGTPAVYAIDHPEVPTIVCCTPTYVLQARVGETIEARGWLEAIADGRTRLLIGSSREAAGEYLRVVHPN